MSSNVPTVKQVAWISIVPQLLVAILLIFFWSQFDVNEPLIFGALTYIAISYSLRTLVPRDQRNGMRLVKQEKFADAISYFEKSYDFFDRNRWLDKYRYLALLNSSKMSYREMALNNIAFCYSQIGEGDKSKLYYERTLEEFPDSGMAKAALRFLDAVNKN
jgi:tetratricopeptide (TPR) repeat protein